MPPTQPAERKPLCLLFSLPRLAVIGPHICFLPCENHLIVLQQAHVAFAGYYRTTRSGRCYLRSSDFARVDMIRLPKVVSTGAR